MTLRRPRVVVAAAALVLAAFAALVLLDAGMAIGAASRPAIADAGTVTPAADAAVASDIDALLAADETAAPQPAAASPSGAPGPINPRVAPLRRLARARKLVHATVVVDLPKLGGLTTIQLDHGTISAVSASSLTLTEKGSPAVTVTFGDKTRVRRHGDRANIADLKTGEEAFVMSRVEANGAEAYLVVVPAD